MSENLTSRAGPRVEGPLAAVKSTGCRVGTKDAVLLEVSASGMLATLLNLPIEGL
jgi:hypothetical protein